MAIYKIQNITNTGDKRRVGFNSDVTISFASGMINKTATIKAGDVLFLDIDSLPMSVHKLRAKGFISVVEVGKNEINISQYNARPKNVAKLPVKGNKIV
jgi:hypothetical protein